MASTQLLNGSDAGRWAEGAPNARSAGFQRLGTPQGAMAALYPLMYQDTKFHVDTFLGLSLDPVMWDSDATVGADLWSVDSGTAYAGTGTVDDNALSLWGAEALLPSKNCGAEFRFKVSAITAFQLEAGLVNRGSGDMLVPVISDIDTPAAVSGDTGAVFHIDTDQTLTTGAFVTSAASGATVEKTNVGTFTPTADNYYTLRVQTVFDGSSGYSAFFYLWDTNASRMTLVSSGSKSLAVSTNATTKLRPWFYLRTRSTVEKTATLTYAARWMDQ